MDDIKIRVINDICSETLAEDITDQLTSVQISAFVKQLLDSSDEWETILLVKEYIDEQYQDYLDEQDGDLIT